MPAGRAKPYSSYEVATTVLWLKSCGGAKEIKSPLTLTTDIKAPPMRYCVPASSLVRPSASPYVDAGNRTFRPSPCSILAKPKSMLPKLMETSPTKPGALSTLWTGVASRPTLLMAKVMPWSPLPSTPSFGTAPFSINSMNESLSTVTPKEKVWTSPADPAYARMDDSAVVASIVNEGSVTSKLEPFGTSTE